MASKKELFRNLHNFPPEEIAEAVRRGEVTIYELSKNTNGAFTPLLKRRVQAILANPKGNVNAAPESPPQPDAPMAPQLFPQESGSDDMYPLEPEEQGRRASSDTGTQMSSGNKGMFIRPFSFKGRIRRLEFGISWMIYLVWYIIGEVLMIGTDSLGAVLFVLIPVIPMIWFMLAQATKRCHDRGLSGWFQLIPFFYLVLLFGKGEPGPNKYGDSPKE